MRARTSVKPKGSKTVDPVTGQHLLNASWLAAGFGSATLQLRLLAQAVPALQGIGASRYLGSGIAALALAWLLGTRFGRALTRRGSAFGWGAWLLACALCWLVVTALGFTPALPLAPDLLHLAAFGLLALVLALVSAAWLAHERPWPAVGEGTAQGAGLVGILFGLAVTWVFPDWSGAAGCALLLPLLLLDLCPPARCPLPTPRGAHPPILSRPGEGRGAGGPSSARRVAGRPTHAGWWWPWLARRGQLAQTLLGSGVTLATASVWSVVPTLYALALAREQSLEVLLWLIGGQLAAFLVGATLLLSRGGMRLLGAPDHRIAPAVRRFAFAVEWSALGLAALGLAALGNPWQQAPWFLSLAIFGYTLAMGAWHRVYARLVPSLAPETGIEQHFSPWMMPQAAVDDLAGMRRQRDELARRCVASWETVLLLVAIPLTGLLSDAWGIDPVLMLAGCVLLAGLGLALIVGSSPQRPSADADHHRQESLPLPAGAQGVEPETGMLGRVSQLEPSRDAAGYGSGERATTAQYQILLPHTAAEQTDREAVQDFAPLPLNRDEGGDEHAFGNGSTMY
jgi:hypothetical protein